MRIKHILISILFTAFILSCESSKVDKALALEVPTTYEDPCDVVDDFNLVLGAYLSLFPKDLEELELKAFLEENQDVMDDLQDIGNSMLESISKSKNKKNLEDCDKFEDVERINLAITRIKNKYKELSKYM